MRWTDGQMLSFVSVGFTYIERSMTCLVSLAAVFWAVPPLLLGGALRDSPKNGCEGDYDLF